MRTEGINELSGALFTRHIHLQFDTNNAVNVSLIWRPLILLLCCLYAQGARAQTSPTNKEAGQHIAYERKLPPSVARLMPRGAKSLFWGTFSPRVGETSLAIHLYNTRREEPNHNFTRVLGLNVFQSKGDEWQRINRIPLRYPTSFGGTTQVVDSQLLWLDSQQTIPLLKLRVFVAEVPEGDDISLVFLKGWKGKTVCDYWPWGSRYSCPIDNDWSQRDENGFLEVVSDLTNTMSMSNPAETTYYQWREGSFHLVRHTALEMRGGDTFETIEIPIKE